MMKKGKEFQSLQTLKRRRKQIDLIDQKLLSLLNHRLSIALKIGKIKRERREKIYNPKRENEILERLNLLNRGPLRREDLKKIFKKIMIVCRKSQSS
jgi:chorismate mutase/prephenate dehydratase